jgi:hypothetical protein
MAPMEGRSEEHVTFGSTLAKRSGVGLRDAPGPRFARKQPGELRGRAARGGGRSDGGLCDHERE